MKTEDWEERVDVGDTSKRLTSMMIVGCELSMMIIDLKISTSLGQTFDSFILNRAENQWFLYLKLRFYVQNR